MKKGNPETSQFIRSLGVSRFVRARADCQDEDGDPRQKPLYAAGRQLGEFIGSLQADGLAPSTLLNYVKGVKALFRSNGLILAFPYRITQRRVCMDRAPRPEDLQRLIDVADLRKKSHCYLPRSRRVSRRYPQ
jgi:hypothetical protein